MLEAMETQTGITPQALQNEPELDVTTGEIASAYNLLAARRSYGSGPNPIQLSEILAYVEIFGCPVVGMEAFVELIGVTDVKYLETVDHGNKQRKRTDSKSVKQPRRK